MHALELMVRAYLPWLSHHGQTVFHILIRLGGRMGSATFFAAALGLRNRHQLTRMLRREGLPPLEELSGWTAVLCWILEWEHSGLSLFRLAMSRTLEPATK